MYIYIHILPNIFGHIPPSISWGSPISGHPWTFSSNRIESTSPKSLFGPKKEHQPFMAYYIWAHYRLVMTFTVCELEAMAIEIVDLSIKNGGSFHSYISLPEGIIFH